MCVRSLNKFLARIVEVVSKCRANSDFPARAAHARNVKLQFLVRRAFHTGDRETALSCKIRNLI